MRVNDRHVSFYYENDMDMGEIVIDKKKTALLIIDMQHVFITRPVYENPTEEQKKEAEKAKQNEKKKDDKKKDDKKKEEDKKATDNKKDSKDIVVELNNIEDRIVRLTPNSSSLGDAIITQDGNTLFYLSRFESGYDLWKLDVKKRAPQLAQKGIGNGAFETDAKGNIYLLGGSLKKINSMSGAGTPVNVQGSLKMNLSDERETMFNHVCLQIEKRFYEKNLQNAERTVGRTQCFPHRFQLSCQFARRNNSRPGRILRLGLYRKGLTHCRSD